MTETNLEHEAYADTIENSATLPVTDHKSTWKNACETDRLSGTPKAVAYRCSRPIEHPGPHECIMEVYNKDKHVVAASWYTESGQL